MISRQYISKISGIPEKDLVIGFTASTFDLLTAGHCLMLEESKNQCNFLVVGLQTNPQNDRAEKNKPVQTMFERFIQISSSKYVDYVIPFDDESDLLNLILTLNPDIRIVGEEYKRTEHTGKHLTPIYYNKRRHNFSSTELRIRTAAQENSK